MNPYMNNYNPQHMNMMMNDFQNMMNNNMGNNIMVMRSNNNINVQEINNEMFMMFQQFLQMHSVDNNNDHNIRPIPPIPRILHLPRDDRSVRFGAGDGDGMYSNNINDNHTNTGNHPPVGILESVGKFNQIKVDDCDIRYIKFIFISSSGCRIMISINKNRPLKDLFKEFAKKVGIPEFNLGVNIFFIFDALYLDVNDEKNTINNIFPKDLITITVIDSKEVIGANN